MNRDRLVRLGAASIAVLFGATLGCAAGVAFSEWAVHQHRERASDAEVRAWKAEHELAMERSLEAYLKRARCGK